MFPVLPLCSPVPRSGPLPLTAVPGESETVSPWEVEVDPEEERRREAEALRLQQAAARAFRGNARQSSRR